MCPKLATLALFYGPLYDSVKNRPQFTAVTLSTRLLQSLFIE